MAPEPYLPVPGHLHERSAADRAAAAGPAEERKTMPGPRRNSRQPGLLDAGPLGADIASFRLHLAAEGKSARTVQGYTSAVRWFAAAWPRRPATAPLGRSKAAAVREAAWMLRQEDINIAGHITAGNTAAAKRVLQSVPGIGYATASYFLMLLGAPGIKPDRMIHRFLQDATGHSSTNARAEQLLQATAETLGAEAHELDHAIWRYQSTRAQHRR